ncbi:hypothetical protein B0H13DRAFT_2282166 [Mycena leptocephala]|nr:hypothetical protein B0H13DRAFT_2282166 [Mycena leptocephala]
MILPLRCFSSVARDCSCKAGQQDSNLVSDSGRSHRTVCLALTCLAVRMLRIPSARLKKQPDLQKKIHGFKSGNSSYHFVPSPLTEGELKDYLDTQDYIDSDAQDTEDEDFDMNADAGTSDGHPPTRGLSEEQVATQLARALPLFLSILLHVHLARGGTALPRSFRQTLFLRDGCREEKLTELRAHRNMLENEVNDFYKRHPEEHPAYMAMDRPPAILLPYHPDASKRRSQITCKHDPSARPCCLRSHVHGSEDLPSIPSRHPPLEDIPFLEFRTYPSGISVPTRVDFLDTTIGRAFVDWNSRIGIPQDVWTMITTASGPDELYREGQGREVVLYRNNT